MSFKQYLTESVPTQTPEEKEEIIAILKSIESKIKKALSTKPEGQNILWGHWGAGSHAIMALKAVDRFFK